MRLRNGPDMTTINKDEIPLLRVRYTAAFADAAQAAGAPIDSLLAETRLDKRLLSVREGFMPVAQAARFAAAAAKASGRFDLGLAASLAPRVTHSEFSLRILHAPTLYQSLRGACAMARTEDTTANLRIVRNGDLAWFCCGPVQGNAEEVRQIELYRYGGMLQMIRYTAGPDWIPSQLRLQSADDGELRDVPLIRDVDAQFGAPHLAIAVPFEILGQAVTFGRDAGAEAAAAVATDPVLAESINYELSVKEIVRTNMLAHRCKVSDVAASIGTSPRSLQRRLGERGVNFTDLLDRTRAEIARVRLLDTETSVPKIAAELGYRHATHFARAFRRVCGVSPREYRRLQGA